MLQGSFHHRRRRNGIRNPTKCSELASICLSLRTALIVEVQVLGTVNKTIKNEKVGVKKKRFVLVPRTVTTTTSNSFLSYCRIGIQVTC